VLRVDGPTHLRSRRHNIISTPGKAIQPFLRVPEVRLTVRIGGRELLPGIMEQALADLITPEVHLAVASVAADIPVAIWEVEVLAVVAVEGTNLL
jgi:hypothetical protein